MVTRKEINTAFTAINRLREGGGGGGGGGAPGACFSWWSEYIECVLYIWALTLQLNILKPKYKYSVFIRNQELCSRCKTSLKSGLNRTESMRVQ